MKKRSTQEVDAFLASHDVEVTDDAPFAFFHIESEMNNFVKHVVECPVGLVQVRERHQEEGIIKLHFLFAHLFLWEPWGNLGGVVCKKKSKNLIRPDMGAVSEAGMQSLV